MKTQLLPAGASDPARRRPISDIFWDEAYRLEEFPVARQKVFFAHAGVTALPRRVAETSVRYTLAASEDQQEFGSVLERVDAVRSNAAALIDADPDEIALLGPTSLGLSLFANGIPWREGDEILCYFDDYPANVYPWLEQRRRGVEIRFLKPEVPGAITPELVLKSIGPNTRLVALASCHYLTGYRIDVDTIGGELRRRRILFSLDAIQTLGAFPTSVREVDMLSADAHKWLLGPLAAGIVFVRKEHFDLVRPTLVGAWNAHSPDFIAREEVRFPATGRRYEPGVLNVSGILGMDEAIGMLQELGIGQVASRILDLKAELVEGLKRLGFFIHGPEAGPNATGITTAWRPDLQGAAGLALFEHLGASGIACSYRKDRWGRCYFRFSPHFYNTPAEVERALAALADAPQNRQA